MSTWEEAFKIMQQASRRLDKLDAKTRAKALGWIVEKYVGDELGEAVLEAALDRAEDGAAT